MSDNCDIFQTCEQHWGTKLKEAIEPRNGTQVVRPDSGALPGVVLRVLEVLESMATDCPCLAGGLHRPLPGSAAAEAAQFLQSTCTLWESACKRE